MYIAGCNIMRSYLNDPNKTAKVRDYSVGLSVISISQILGGRVCKDILGRLNTRPIGVQVEDKGARVYNLDEGSYQLIMEQGLNKLPKDAVATLKSSAFAKSIGCIVEPQEFLEYSYQGNISSILIVPSNCKVQIEVGANLLDIFIHYEKFEMEA